MKNPKTFVLNLSRQRISLGMISVDGIMKELDSFDPNEPAGSQSLRKLFFLAKALSQKDPLVEVVLPNDIIQYETFISENAPTISEIKNTIINRSKTPHSDIEIALGEKVGSRAVSIAFAETAVLEELKKFISTAGFKIKCFRAGENITGFNKNNNLFPKYCFKANKLSGFLELRYAAAIAMIIGTLLFLNLKYGFYDSKNLAEFSPPEVNTDLLLSEYLANNIDDITFSNDTLSNIYTPNISGQKKTFPKIRISSQDLYQASSIKQQELTNFARAIPPTLIYKPGFWFRDYDLSADQIGAPPLSKSKLIKEERGKVSELFATSIEGSSSAPSTKYFSNLPTANMIALEFQKDAVITKVKLEKFYKYARNITNLPKQTIANQEDLPIEANLETSLEEDPNSNKSLGNNTQFEGFVEKYTLELMPYKKPLIIDNIKILSEPTLSTGALAFLNSPLLRPDIIIQSKPVKVSQVSLSARATKSPSIPKSASIWHNSTRTNFIDLDRTNLIGILGKSSNPRAMIRLSNGTILKLKVGDGFQGWRIFAIDRDKIHVENGSKQEILHLPG